MQFTVLTLFPDLVEAFFSHGMIGRALEKGLAGGSAVNIRDFAHDRHRTVDDKPYGGGAGMVMKTAPLAEAVEAASNRSDGGTRAKVVMMSPQGALFDQEKALALASENRDLVFVCGRYEGIDQRVSDAYVDEELSIGDYVMTGGELAAMVIIDAVARLLPGVLGSEASADFDSFRDERLEHAHYTRPFDFQGREVPEVLMSGHHGKIQEWRKKASLQRTFINRPDLFQKRPPDAEEKAILRSWCRELENLVNE